MSKRLLSHLPLLVLGALLALVLVFKLVVSPSAADHQVEILLPAPQANKPAAAPAATPAPLKSIRTDILVLSAKNTVSLRGVVTQQSVALAEAQLLEMSHRLNENDTIYLVLNTPGGEVIAGTQFIDFLRPLPQRVKPVVIFAASMGFQITQHLDERIITPNGTLMSHRAMLGVQGQVPGELLVELNHILKLLQRLDLNDAARMGLSLQDYRAKIYSEYWVDGYDAVADHAADKVMYIRCGADLSGTEKVMVQTIFGAVGLTFSKCPTITGPLAIDLNGLKFKTELEREEFMKYQDLLFNSKEDFVKRYILTNEFTKIQPK